MIRSTVLIAAVALASCGSSNKTTMTTTDTNQAMDNAGWESLFDGKTTSGWHAYNKSDVGKAWKVEDGALHLDAAAKKDAKDEGGDIVTDKEYENYRLKLEWKISPKGNSGIIIFVNEDKQYANTYNTGPEVQVLDNGTPTMGGHPDAKLYTHRAGDLYDLLAAKEAAKPAGEWNEVEVVADKGKLDFYMNGQHTLSTTMWDDAWIKMIAISKFKDMPGFGKFKKGKIGLQDHGNDVWYRNIKIKQL